MVRGRAVGVMAVYFRLRMVTVRRGMRIRIRRGKHLRSIVGDWDGDGDVVVVLCRCGMSSVVGVLHWRMLGYVIDDEVETRRLLALVGPGERVSSRFALCWSE